MEQNNYLSLVKIFGNATKENDKTNLDKLKFLFKTFIFGDKKIFSLNQLWFEKDEIKVDIEYYQLIQSLITIFIKYFSDEASFKEDLLSKEIFSLFKKTKYFCLYQNLLEICYIFELREEYYTEISCALYILGIKKGTPINDILVGFLEDFTENELVENSKFSSQIRKIKYDTINDSFMNNLKLLYNLIKSNGDEEEIKQKLIYIEKTGNKDKKLNEEIKNFQNILNIDSQAISKKDDISAEKNQSNDSARNEVNKYNKKEVNIIESSKSNNNKNLIYSDYSLEELLNFIKIKSEELKKEEKEIKTEQESFIEKYKNKIMNLVYTIFKIQNRFNLIVQQLAKCKKTIKEIALSELSKKIFYENKIEIEKFLIEINLMKSVIELLGTPSIIIVKKKLLDMIIYSLIKTNKDKFEIDKNYCPNENILKKLLKKIEKYSDNIIRKDDIDKNKTSKNYINELINKNQSSIEFPFSCTDKYLNIIIGYLSFCKSKYNKVEKENKQDRKNKVEVNSQNSRPLKINIDIVLEYFIKNNLVFEDDDSKFKKKLEELESKKNSLIDKYFSSTSEGWKTLLNDYDKFDKKEQENYMSAFNFSEKELINEIIKDFEDSLRSLKNNLLKLNEIEDETEKKELLEQFFSKYHQITERELSFDESDYLKLSEIIKERYLLIFFQIQLTKYSLLNFYSKSFAKILNDNLESNKKLIINEYSELKAQLRQLLDEMKKSNKIKSARKLFIEWKITKLINIKDNFETFIDNIKKYVDSVELRFNDEVISDKITSLWIIKNDLEQYVD